MVVMACLFCSLLLIGQGINWQAWEINVLLFYKSEYSCIPHPDPPRKGEGEEIAHEDVTLGLLSSASFCEKGEGEENVGDDVK